LKRLLKSWASQNFGDGTNISNSIKQELLQVQRTIMGCNDVSLTESLTAQECLLTSKIAKGNYIRGKHG